MNKAIKENQIYIEEKIIRKKDLFQLGNDINFIDSSLNGKDCICVKQSIEDFLDFCRKNNINDIFYEYEFYDIDKFLITDEMIKDNTFSKKEFRICRAKADERNNETESFDFDEPELLVLMAIYDGIILVRMSKNDWLKDYKTASDYIIEFTESLEELPIDEDEENADDNYFTISEELREKLLSDSKFRLSTNKSSRINYFREFMQKKENQKYLSLFRKSKDSYYRGEQLLQLMHQIYAQYKLDCYKYKLHLGEPLPDTDADNEIDK